MWIKVRLILLVSAALLTKTEAIDFLLVLSLYCTNRRFPTLLPRHYNYSHDSNHRRKSNSVNVQYSHVEMGSIAIQSLMVCKILVNSTFTWSLLVHKCEFSVDKAGSLFQQRCENLINSVNKFPVEGCDMHDSVSHSHYLSLYSAFSLLVLVIIWVSG